MSRLCLRGVRDSVSHPLHSSLMDLALGMACCWINWLKSRKTGHGKEKRVELQESARWEAGVEQ